MRRSESAVGFPTAPAGVRSCMQPLSLGLRCAEPLSLLLRFISPDRRRTSLPHPPSTGPNCSDLHDILRFGRHRRAASCPICILHACTAFHGCLCVFNVVDGNRWVLVQSVLMQLPPFWKVVFTVMLSVEAAKAFDIWDKDLRFCFFFIFIVYYRSTINNHSSKKRNGSRRTFVSCLIIFL